MTYGRVVGTSRERRSRGISRVLEWLGEFREEKRTSLGSLEPGGDGEVGMRCMQE